MIKKTKTTNESSALPAWKGSANKRRTRGLIGTELLQIFEIYDDTSVAAHLVNILRSKGNVTGYKPEKHKVAGEDGKDKWVTIQVPVYKDPYYNKDEETLKDIETYRAKLDESIIDQEDNEG